MAVHGTGVVAWADTDASGWIHFTAPLRWVEQVEHSAARAAGVEPGAFPRRAVSVDYLRPLRAGQTYEVELRAERVGRTSVTYAWVVRCDGADAVSGTHTAVHLGDDGRPTEVPSALAEAYGD